MSVNDQDSFSFYTGSMGGGGGPVVAGEGRDGLGGLRVPDHFTYSYTLRCNASSIRTIFSGWLRGGRSGVWNADGSDYLEFQNVSDGPLSVASDGGGGLKVWQYYDGGGGSPTVLGSAPSVLADPDTFYHVEVLVDWDTSAGVVRIRVSGVTVLTLTGLDLGQTSGPVAVELCSIFYQGASTPCDFVWDDVFTMDGEGGYANDFLGPRDLYCLVPTADGTYLQFTPSGLSGGHHYDHMNELPFNHSNFVFKSDAAVGTTDTYQMSDIAGSSGAARVPAAKFLVLAGNASSTSYDFVAHVISGASEIDTSPDAGVDSSVDRVGFWLTTSNPFTSAPWTVADINGLEMGPKITAQAGSTFAFPFEAYIEIISPDVVVQRRFAFGTIVGA